LYNSIKLAYTTKRLLWLQLHILAILCIVKSFLIEYFDALSQVRASPQQVEALVRQHRQDLNQQLMPLYLATGQLLLAFHPVYTKCFTSVSAYSHLCDKKCDKVNSRRSEIG
jgi:hypothetical protein